MLNDGSWQLSSEVLVGLDLLGCEGGAHPVERLEEVGVFNSRGLHTLHLQSQQSSLGKQKQTRLQLNIQENLTYPNLKEFRILCLFVPPPNVLLHTLYHTQKHFLPYVALGHNFAMYFNEGKIFCKRSHASIIRAFQSKERPPFLRGSNKQGSTISITKR